MRVYRPSRSGRLSRSRIVASGGGGGALPARTTPPTWQGFGQHTRTDDSTHQIAPQLAGDPGVLLSLVTSITATGSITDQVWSRGETRLDDELAGTGLGTTWGQDFSATAVELVNDGVNGFLNVTKGTVSNYLKSYAAIVFAAASVDGSVTCPFFAAGDDLSVMGFGSVDANTVEWPVVDVPTGYMAVYMFILNVRDTTLAFSGIATRDQLDSFASTGASLRTGTANGPTAGTGLQMTGTGLVADVVSRGATAAIFLVPGT